MKFLYLLAITLATPALFGQTEPAANPAAAARELIARVLPEHAGSFV